VVRVGNEQIVEIWVRILENDESVGFAVVHVEASEPITISRILDSMVQQYGEDLPKDSASRAYSGAKNALLLSRSMVWDVKSHGGANEKDALLVKFTTPVLQNQAITDGT
jgi:hypothetical protein